MEFFAARGALDIESVGGIVADKLVERGLVREALDLFELKVDQLAKLNLGTEEAPRRFRRKERDQGNQRDRARSDFAAVALAFCSGYSRRRKNNCNGAGPISQHDR